MITEELINNADEKVKSLYSENKRLWCWIYIILLYFIFKFKNNLEHRKDNISPSMTLSH